MAHRKALPAGFLLIPLRGLASSSRSPSVARVVGDAPAVGGGNEAAVAPSGHFALLKGFHGLFGDQDGFITPTDALPRQGFD